MKSSRQSKCTDIVFTIDNTFIQHFYVTLTSLLENNRHVCFNTYLVHSNLDAEVQQKARSFFLSKYNTDVIFIHIDDALFQNFKVDQHAAKANYFRFLLPDILPKNLNKILYLDCDLVVVGDISELLSVEFNGEYIFAVDNCIDAAVHRLNQHFGFSKSSSYFNSGVMVVNLKKWRDDSISKKAIKLAELHKENIVWWDQDVLNIMFEGKWSGLHPKFNYVYELNEKYKKVSFKPFIIHFPDSQKAWHYLCKNPYKKLYWRYLKKTPFRGYREPDRNLKNMAKKTREQYDDFSNNFMIRTKATIKTLLRPAIKRFAKNTPPNAD